METVLDALPGQPLTAEDVAVLNDTPTVRLLPYTWYGDQVIAVLLLYDQRRSTDHDENAETADEDQSEPKSEDVDDQPTEDVDDQPTEDVDDKPAEAVDDPSTEEGDDTTAGFGTTSSSGFGTRDRETVGTVEVIGDDSLAPDAESTEEQHDQRAADDGQRDTTSQPDSEGPDETDSPTDHSDIDGQPDDTDADGQRDDAGTDDDLHVYAAGYNDTEGSWVVIAEIDPDAEFTDAEPLFREWLTSTYPDQIVDRLAVGPSEYEL